jgi:hypothetical protein
MAITAATAPIISAILAAKSSRLGMVVAGSNGGIGDIDIDLLFFDIWPVYVLAVRLY